MAKRKKRKSKKKDELKKKKGLSIKPETARSILQLLLYALSALVLVSFSRRGVFLVQVNDFLVLQFGLSAIFLPFILLSFGLYLSKFSFPLGHPNVLLGSLIFFLSFSSISRTGKFGNTSWDGISTLLTPIGSFVLLFVMILISFVIMFNTSFDQFILFFFSIFRVNSKKSKLENKKDKKTFSLGNREIKIQGGADYGNQNEDKPKRGILPIRNQQKEEKSDFSSNLISNSPSDNQMWKYPPLSLLDNSESGKADRGDIKSNAATIEETLDSFGIGAKVVEVNMGPAVTQYAIEVSLGTKLSKIVALERDLALALAAPGGSIRIEAPIPGRSLVGIELPNRSPESVPLRKMLESDIMRDDQNKLTVALGLDVSGKPVVANISKMPHVLIAGQTGSGKSVCLNAFLSSILFRCSPQEVKFILVDPKRVEMTNYNNIPHLLTPVIVEPAKVVSSLKWLMSEMDNRYQLFAQAGVRNIDGYNEMSGFQALPYIVLVIDELADIMLFAPADVEDAITRLAQMSRATGIHMVLATQRPSVDVITGLIKANIPARIAFAVSSLIDSRVILDSPGAEKLLGKGDMLYLSPSQAKPSRIQGAFITDKETNDLVSFLKGQGIEPQYSDDIITMTKNGTPAVNIPGLDGDDADDLFKDAVELVCKFEKASTSLIQRRLKVGYSRAARILDQLESAGVVGPAAGSKPRDVLIQSASDLFGSSDNS